MLDCYQSFAQSSCKNCHHFCLPFDKNLLDKIIFISIKIHVCNNINSQLVQVMDLKFRLKQPDDGRRTVQNNQNGSRQQRNTIGGNGFEKYARKPNTNFVNNQRNTVQPQKLATSVTPSAPSNRENINKYYRSGAAPKNQFKHFLSDSNNVFYDQRPSLALLSKYHDIRLVTGILFAILTVIFIGLIPITPFSGICPHNAQCGVFVHCFSGFKYDKNLNQCVLSEELYSQIEQILTDRITKARQEWAQKQCQGEQQQNTPIIRIQELLSSVNDYSLQKQLRARLQDFLHNPENQQNLHFTYHSQTIRPTQKKYSVFCLLQKFVNTSKFKLGFPASLVILMVLIYLFKNIRRKIIAKNIYDQLRKRTFAQNMLNISYAKADLQKQYGTIDQKTWEIVDEYRSKDRDIGFLQDDFLYWKVL